MFLLPFGFGLVWSPRFTAFLRVHFLHFIVFFLSFSSSRQTAFSDASALHSMHVCMASSTQPVTSTPLIWAVATAGRGQPAFEYFNIKVFVSLSTTTSGLSHCWREALLPGIRRLNNKEHSKRQQKGVARSGACQSVALFLCRPKKAYSDTNMAKR